MQEADWRDRMKTPTRNHCIKQSKTEALQGILRHHAQLLAHLWKNPCFIKKITFYNFSLMISSVYTVYLDHLYPTLPSLHLPFCSPMCNHPPDQRATHQWPHSQQKRTPLQRPATTNSFLPGARASEHFPYSCRNANWLDLPQV